jgi:hypothetical protein
MHETGGQGAQTRADGRVTQLQKYVQVMAECVQMTAHTRVHAELDWENGTGWTRAVSHLWMVC